jgi:hypothetical protein
VGIHIVFIAIDVNLRSDRSVDTGRSKEGRTWLRKERATVRKMSSYPHVQALMKKVVSDGKRDIKETNP